MIGGSAEKCAQQPFAAGTSGIFRLRGLQGDKHRINFSQNFGVGNGQDPALLRLIIFGKWAEIAQQPWVSVFLSPNVEGIVDGVGMSGSKVVGVKHQRLALGIENATEG